MSKSNKKAKEELIRLYGAKCFIEVLHLRKGEKNRRYKSKKQYRKMKQLTYHHILEKSKGGRATVKNGALLSYENHEWFNKQSKKEQQRMNKMFQDYKINFAKIKLGETIEVEPIKIPEVEEYYEIPLKNNIYENMTEEEIRFYYEHKNKRNRRIYKDRFGVDYDER